MSAARLGLLLALGLGAAVRWSSPAAVADLRPRPDALEYEEAARSLARGDGYGLVLDGKKYPPRYPLGFSALIAPVLLVLGDEPGTGIRVVLGSALAAIAATWHLGRTTGGAAGATAAAIFLALLPLHVRWSKAVMSDVPASAAVAGLAAWTVDALRRRAGWREWLALGAVSGLAATIRPTNLLLLAPTLALLAVRRAGSAAIGALALGVVAGLVPWCLHNTISLGSPLAGGYGLWAPGDYFGWRFAFTAPVAGGPEPNLVFYARALAGAGTLYPWPVAVLALAGTTLALTQGGVVRAVAVIALGFTVALSLLHAFFFWQWDRYLLPALPMLLVLAALPLTAAAPRAIRAAALVLAGVALLGVLRSPARYAPPDRDLQEVATLEAIAARIEPNAAVLVHTNTFFFARYLRRDADRIWLPVGSCDHRAGIRVFHVPASAARHAGDAWIRDTLEVSFDAQRADAAIAALLAEGRPVYYSTLLGFQVPFTTELRAMLSSRYTLTPVWRSARWELVRVSPAR